MLHIYEIYFNFYFTTFVIYAGYHFCFKPFMRMYKYEQFRYCTHGENLCSG